VTNRLAGSTSPYLRQHADNPVDWQEWGPSALAEAVRRDVPLLVSIGYAACHWCHVMAHESFEDPAVGEFVNAHFVPVKVDREERPDVDAVFMQATVALTGSGGWPMTVFATPEGAAFHCGTYYPPRPAHGMPSFPHLLQAVSGAWAADRGEIVATAGRIADALAATETDPVESGALVEGNGLGRAGSDGAGLDETGLDRAAAALVPDFDPDHPGFGRSPKFPPSTVLEFLRDHAARTGSVTSAAMADATLTAIARGGIHDQLAGGIARYSVDRAWVVPHFEKMLYDNALLLRVATRAWVASGDPEVARLARGIARFLLTDLRTPQGGFAASLDADTPVPAADGTVHGIEGATYVWTPAQLADVLGAADGAWAAGLFGVTGQGTFEHGTSTLRLPGGTPADASRFDDVCARLLAARRERPQPARDDKVVTAWNALAVDALVRAGAVFDEPAWTAAALEAARLLVATNTTVRGRLLRTSRDGRPGTADAVLEDVAALAGALVTLAGATGDGDWLDRAGGLLEDVLDRFGDGAGGFADTAADSHAASGLPRRPRDPVDGPTPSGTNLAAGALLSYAAATGSRRHREAAAAALAPTAALAGQAPRAVAWGLSVAEGLLAGPVEIAVVGPDGDPLRRALAGVAWRAPSAGAVVVIGEPDSPGLPLLAGRPMVDGRAAAHVCRGFLCHRPVTAPADLAAELAQPPERAPVGLRP